MRFRARSSYVTLLRGRMENASFGNSGHHCCSRSPQVLPLEDQTLAKGHLLFSIFPWHDFDYAGELGKSNASRSLQVGRAHRQAEGAVLTNSLESSRTHQNVQSDREVSHRFYQRHGSVLLITSRIPRITIRYHLFYIAQRRCKCVLWAQPT